VLKSFLNRLRFSRHVEQATDGCWYFLGPGVRCFLGHNSKIILHKSSVKIGVPLPGTPRYATKSTTVIHLGDNAKLEFFGNVFIAPGTTIRVKDDAVLTFCGQNSVGHDSLLFCGKRVILGQRARLSWNVTLMDDDGHSFFDMARQVLPRRVKPLVIGDNVGIQMNVVIPRGVTIGENSIISANTVLRQDVRPNCLVFSHTELKVRDNVTTGFQFQ
jgi:acetyltransferase-like isoleucine patch superfamily enzyme